MDGVVVARYAETAEAAAADLDAAAAEFGGDVTA
jgi:hypothetical protein